MPGADLIALVPHYARNERIARLEQMPGAEVPGLPGAVPGAEVRP